MSGLDNDAFNVVMLLFRVAMGLTFAFHGYAKMFRGGRIAGTAGWFDSIGMKPGRLHATMASVTEQGSGVLLALGLFTPFAAAGVVGVMLVAAWVVHRKSGFLITGNGWEYTFVTALMAVVIGALGPGDISLDQAFGLKDGLNGWTGLVVAVVLGLAGGVAQLALFYRPPVVAAETA
jgi:putative oxidoreductase